MILNVGHIEIQDYKTWFEDVQMVSVLQVFEQRAIRDNARVHDLN